MDHNENGPVVRSFSLKRLDLLLTAARHKRMCTASSASPAGRPYKIHQGGKHLSCQQWRKRSALVGSPLPEALAHGLLVPFEIGHARTTILHDRLYRQHL